MANYDFAKMKFPVVNRAPPGDARNLAFEARCSCCGALEYLSANKTVGMPPDQITLKFRALGWQCEARRRDRDICPSCIARSSARKGTAMREKNVIDLPSTENTIDRKLSSSAPTKAEPPGQMTREDRRIIFAKLNDVYVDEKVGYSSGWTDHVVAKDLNIPRAWVSTVREEHFGPDASNEEIRTQVNEARRLIADARMACSKAETLRQDALSAVNRLKEMVANIQSLDQAAGRVEKAVEKLAKSVGV